MKEILKRGATSNILRVFLADSASTTGAGKTGLTNTSSGLIISTIADVEATATTYTSAASNTETITTLGTFAAPSSGKARFKEVDATNFPGIYEIQIADARFNVSNAQQLLVSIQCTGVAPTFAEVQLVTVDLYDSTRFGLTALPDAAAEALGGLATLSANQASNGTIPVNLKTIAGQTANAAAAVTFPASIGTSTLDAAGVWDEVLSGHLTAGSTGAALNAAGSAGDPWATALPGSYGAGTAGKLLSDNLDAKVSTRMAAGNVTVGGFAAGAITSAAFANSAITNAAINNGAISVNKLADGTITAAKIDAAAITSAKFAVGAIDANAIATDAITSAELATSAVNEIVDAVWGANISTNSATAAWANDTFGDRVLMSDSNNQNEVAVTGSNHIAADIHEIQPDEIIDIAQGVLTEATSTSTYAAGDVGNILARLHNMIEADGADYRYTTNALEQAPGGGATSTYVTGNVPYRVKSDEQFPGGVVDINVGTLMRLDLQIVDRDDNPINLTGGTVTVGVRNASTGATVGTDQSATLSLARLGYIYVDTVADWSATAGTYRITVSATLGSDVIVAGPLQLIVRTR